jgi:hypothetical protein
MGRRRDVDKYIEPRAIRVTMDGVTYEGMLFISFVGKNRYQYSVSYGGEIQTNREDLMPDTYLCEVHGRMDLVAMVHAKQRDRTQST